METPWIIFRALITGTLLLGIAVPSLSAQALPEDTPPPPPSFTPPPPLPDNIRNSVPKSLPPDLPDPQDLIAQLKQLDELLSLPSEKLQKLKETVELIEKMTPEERLSMRIRLSKVTRMTPELKSEIYLIAQRLEISDRKSFTQYWLSLDEEKRQSIRDSIFKKDSSEQKVWMNNALEEFITIRDEAFESMKSTQNK